MRKNTQLLLSILFLFSLNIQAQIIEGPTTICDGECGTYFYYAPDNSQPEDITWQLSNGNIFNGNPIDICFSPLGDFTIIAFENGTSNQANFDYTVISETALSISSTAPSCQETQDNDCEEVCSGTSITYSVPADVGIVEWTVTGSDDFIVSGNELTVNWDTPGEGHIYSSIEGEDSPSFNINCGALGNYSEFSSTSGYIHIEGEFDTGYIGVITGTNGFSDSFLPIEGINIIEDILSPENIVEITAPNGEIATCELNLTINETCQFVAYPEYLAYPSSCGACDGGIFINGATPDGNVDFLWSTGETTLEITNLCAGTYTVTVSDGNDCETSRAFTIVDFECTDNSLCNLSDSICVEILEPSLAKFISTPEAQNDIVEICEGQSISFQNQSTGAETFIWDFGDFNTSVETNPEHIYAEPGTYNVSLIARNECFCSDTTNLTVNVLDADIPDIECVGTICEGSIVTYSSAADCGIFNWSISGNGTILSGGGTTDDFVEVEWGNGPLGTVSLAVDNCNGNTCSLPNTETIPIISDDAEIEGLTSVCNGSKAIYTVPKYDGTDYVWTVSNFGNIVEGQGTYRITVEWNGLVPNNSQFVAVDYENCYLECGGSDILEVSIVPEFYAIGVPTVCEGTSETFIGKSYPNNNSAVLNWDLFAPNGTVSYSSNGPSATAEIPFNSGPGTYRLLCTAGNPNDWCTESYELSIVVNPMPVAPNGIIGENSICIGNPYTYTANSNLTNASFVWEITDGNTVSNRTGNPINITWSNSGNYQVSLAQIDTDGLNCQSAFTSQIVNAITDITIFGDPDVCLNEISTYTATNYDDLFYNWTISPPDAGVITAGEGTNQVDIFWTNDVNAILSLNLCGQTVTSSITVREDFDLSVNAPNNLCLGEFATVSSNGVYESYIWKNEFGAVISNAANPSLSSGFYELVVTDEFDCVESTTFQIGQYPIPEVSISTGDDTYICLAAGETWPQLYAENTLSGYTYTWYRNNIVIGTNEAVYQTTSEGSYRVEVLDNNGCISSSNTIYVGEGCITGGGDFPNTGVDCPNSLNAYTTLYCNTFNFESFDLGNQSNHTWYFDDGTTSTELTPSHTYTNPGFYNVYLVKTIQVNGQNVSCVTEEIVTVPVAADFSTISSCAGQAIGFTDLSTFIGNEDITSYSWDFGDPASGNNSSNTQNPTHTYADAGIYSVSLTITGTNGCLSTKIREVEVIDFPNISFPIPAVNCAATSLAFTANTMGNVTDVLWDFGDPASGITNTSSSFSPYHKFSSPGIYTVTLTGTSVYGCSASFSQNVTIEPNALNGNITVVPDDTFCEGESASLTAPSGGEQWFWSTGENTENISVSSSEVFSVTIVDEAGCAYASAGLAINVLPLPQGDIFAIEYDEYGSPISYNFTSYEVCEGEDVFLEVEESSTNTYNWSTGTIGTSEEFSEDKGNQLMAGTYDIEVEITNENTGCTSISVFEIIVRELPQNITIISDSGTPICANTGAIFSVQNPNPDYTYIWNTDEVGTNITIIAGGEYWVTAYNQYGCEAESNHINVENAPNIDKIPDGCHTRCAPDTICLPTLQNVSSYQWYFNGNALAAPNGTQANVVAEESGEYYLVMEDIFGCTSISDVLSLDLFIGTGTFSGEVYYDTNENGIIDAGDELLSDVNINLLDVNGAIQGISTSDASGTYGFPDITSTDYILELDTLSLPDETTYLEYQIERSITGCDYIFYQNWLIVPVCQTLTESIVLTSCDGNSVSYEGTEIAVGESLDFTFQTAIGCDSIVTVNVEDASSALTIETITTCNNENIEYNGVEIAVGETQIFTLIGQSGCDSLVEISVVNSPSPDLVSEVTASCWSIADGSITLSQPINSNSPYEYAIDGGNFQTALTFENLTGTFYTVDVKDANDCIYSYEIEVPTVPNIEVEFENQMISCEETEINLIANASGGRGELNYQWATGENTSDINLSETGVYQLTIEDECGVFNTEVEVQNETDTRANFFYFPTAFSPNGDGHNDEFRGYLADNVELINYELLIFDRWGNMLAEIRDIEEGWKGDFRLRDMDVAVMVYVLKARLVSCGVQRDIELAGDVTILR